MIYYANAYIDALIAEDAPRGDLTSRVLGITGSAQAQFYTRQAVRVSGAELAAKLLAALGCECEILRPSGTDAAPSEAILRAKGRAAAIHQGYKSAQAVLESACAIASRAAAMSAAARAANPRAQVFCTRKAPPGLRALATEAVLAGGAQIHRAGLGESVLIFAQHRALLAAPLAELIARAKAAAPEHKIICEAADLADVQAICAAGAHIVQLDKFSLADAAQALQIANAAGVKVSAAGGINAANVGDYAALGIEILVSSAPYFGAPADIGAKINRI